MPILNIVEIVGEPRPWVAKGGPAAGQEFLSYRVKDDNGTVYEINRKASSGSPPDLGPNDYEITPPKPGTDFPPKIKRVFKGGGGGGAKDAYWTAKEQRDIDGIHRMGRAHAQDMALRALALLHPDLTADKLRVAILKWTDWFQRDVDSAVPGGGAASPPPAPPDLPPPDARDLEPVGAAPDDIPF